jgi:DNA-directed RNA polymerase subunit RPC12/RpoP
MRIRGERECQDCGTRWSYYESGGVECPDCGSLRSVGVDKERTLHTATPGTLDLSPVRNAFGDDEPVREVAEMAVERCREFTRGYGFVDTGELQPLSDTYLGAMELKYVGSLLAGRLEVTEDEELYFLTLLRGVDNGERPGPDAVPDSLRSGRNLAYAAAIDAYRSDLRTYLGEPDPVVGELLGPLRSHLKRVDALDGELPTADTERMVGVLRGVYDYVVGRNESALVEARDRLDRIE